MHDFIIIVATVAAATTCDAISILSTFTLFEFDQAVC